MIRAPAHFFDFFLPVFFLEGFFWADFFLVDFFFVPGFVAVFFLAIFLFVDFFFSVPFREAELFFADLVLDFPLKAVAQPSEYFPVEPIRKIDMVLLNTLQWKKVRRQKG